MQTIIVAKARPVCMTLRCSSQKQENPITVARKAFEKKRSNTVKKNFNKLLFVANTDAKEVGDFFKELDEIHKKELSMLFDKFKSKTITTKEDDNGDEDSNIFIKKQ